MCIEDNNCMTISNLEPPNSYKELLLVLISPQINFVNLKQKHWMLLDSYCADVLRNKFLSVKLNKLLVLKNLLRKERVL